MDNEHIKINTSIPSLKNKIKIDVEGPTERAYWYIRFNIPLDKASVNRDTMNVTDTDGYIMRTYISYDEDENLIVIVPLDSYEQNRYYFLNISKQVRSAKGQQLKHEIHILFKLIDNRISEFEILKRTAHVPKPRPRPANYDEMNSRNKGSTKSKVYAFEKNSSQRISPSDVLPFAPMKINPLLGVVGLIAVLIAALLGIAPLTIGSIVLCFGGVGHLVFQLANRKLRSVISYNRGVMAFNSEKYSKANILFKKALSLDYENEMAEFGLNKVSFYL